MASLPTFGDEGGHDGIDALNGKCRGGGRVQYGTARQSQACLTVLWQSLPVHCPLGQFGVTMLQPCVPVKGGGTNALKQVSMHTWVMLYHKIEHILWNYCMLC